MDGVKGTPETGRGPGSFSPCVRWKCRIQVGLGQKPALQDQHWGCLRAQGLQLRSKVAVYMFLWHEGEKVVK